MSPDVPFDFVKTDASPELAPDFQGVMICADATSTAGRLDRLIVHGAYRIPVGAARDIGAIPLQKALVITITSGRLCWTFNALGGGFAFEDDERQSAGMVRGYFNVDVLQRAPVGSYSDCYVLASIGTFLSNVVPVK